MEPRWPVECLMLWFVVRRSFVRMRRMEHSMKLANRVPSDERHLVRLQPDCQTQVASKIGPNAVRLEAFAFRSEDPRPGSQRKRWL